MLSAMSPGLTALAQEKANAAPAVLTYEDDSITAELKATEGTSLPAGAALNVKALNKDSQDEAEKALYAETEAGLNAKASEQGSSIDGFSAYSITLTDKNKRDITPKTGSFTLKITDKNAAAPEAYKQSPDGQKSIALYQAAEAKDEQNNPVSTMEPKQEDAASINTDPDGNVTGVETALTSLKPVAVTWQNPQQQTAEEENALSVQSEEEQSNALAASYDPNNPGPLTTIETIDSASMGVDIQMFDYAKALPDYTHWGRGQNGMLVQGLVDKELHKNGYVDEYYPETAEVDQWNTSLFDNFVTKNWKGDENNQNYLGKANHLFREDVYTGAVPEIGSAGTFYYSSFDNYAYWPKGAEENVDSDDDGTYPFTVYQQIGTPKLGNGPTLFYYQRGNFMPYNPIKDDKFASNTLNLYDENGKALNPDDARYREKLYKTQQPEWSRYSLQDGNVPTENNYYFGMVVTANFIQQKNGKYNGQDMVYKFNGDDDMWVFIDGVLVLDLGGVRDAQSGEINFSTGEVKWTNYNKKHENAGNLGEGCKDFTKTIKDQFKDTSKENITEWNNNGEGDTFADYTGHEIKIFYMERGAGASNCKMQFNLPTVPKDSISVTKEVTNVNEGAYTDVDFDFKLYVETQKGEDTEGKETIEQGEKTYVLAANEPYTLKDGTDETPGQTTGNDGIFKLKHGQTAYFNGKDNTGITEAGKKYIVQEVGVDKTQYDKFTVSANATDEKEVDVTEKTIDGKTIVQTSPLTVGTNMIVKMQNKCDGENLHTINITKQIDGGQASDDNFTAQVTIGGKPYTGKYKVADKDATEEAWKSAEEKTTADGSISLKASQTIRIEKIAAGTSFEVTETAPDANKYNTPTYDVSNADAIDKTDKASGKVNFGSNPQITITNHLKLSADSISTNKTAKVHDWDDRTYDITLQASSNVTGDVVNSVPYDIVLVLDKSGSMNNEFLDLEEYTGDVFNTELSDTKYYYKTKSGIYQALNVKKHGDTVATYKDTEDNEKTKTVTLKKDTVYYRAEYIKWDEPYFEGSQMGSIFEDTTYKYYYKVPENHDLVADNGKKLNFQKQKYVKLYLQDNETARLYSYTRTGNRYDIILDTFKTVKISEIASNVYIANPSGKSKRAALEEASTQFVSNVSQLSPDSRISIINFASEAVIEKSDEKTFLRVGNPESLNTLKDWTKSHFLATDTRADLGLGAAETVLNDSDKSHWEAVESDKERKKMVVFFTDGVPTNDNGAYSQITEKNAIAAARRLRETNGATVYALGVFNGALNSGIIQEKFTVKQLNNYMTQVAGDPSRYMVANDADSLNKLFSSISTDVGQSIEGATITDVIDSRFELTDEAKAELEASGAVVTVNDTGTTTITWNNQTINQNIGDTAGWERTFRVRAKEDYIGANNVTTNAAGSQVQVGEITKPFESPVVNVKADINLLDQARTIFYDETVPNEGDLLTRIGEIQQKSDDSKGKYGTNDCQIEWKDENGNATSIAAMTQDKPEKDTHYTVNVSYNAGAPSDDGKSTENTDGHKNGDNDNNTVAAQGKYDVHVVKGQLEITKTIDKPYTNIKQINANQTFVFKIERYEVEQNGSKGKLAETFYETINFNANETGTEKTKLVSGLKKGYYTVTEETNWSQKYNLTETTDNYTEETKDAKDLLIGDHLREATQDNPKPEFYGLDETKLKNNNGEELPAAQQYSNFAEGSKATVKFTNNLSTTWKWLSDTAAAVNVFDQKAQ